MRRAAWAWTLAVVVVLGFVFLTTGFPRDLRSHGMLGTIELPAQLILLGVALAGLVLARWSEAATAVILVLVGAGLAGLSSRLHSPVFVVLTVVVFVVPAVAFWVVWGQGPSRRAGARDSVLAGLVLAAWAAGAGITYHQLAGATHPESAALDLPVDQVEWIWSGAVTDTSFRVTARIDDPLAERATLVIEHGRESAQRAALPAPVDAVGPEPVPASGVVTWTVDGLEADTSYQYTVIVDDHADTTRGQGEIRTFPDGPASFTIAVGACARTGSNAAVFDTIRAVQPQMFIHTGDFHYGNIDFDDIDMFRARYADVLASPGQSALYRSVPTAYVWDDHDYGANDADANSPSRPAARAAFRENVPHYELPDGTDDGAIYQAFTAGRVRFILTDVRSERTADSMLGARQLEWFEEEMLGAAEDHALIVWVNAVPWIGPEGQSRDNWTGYPEERRHVAEIIEEAGVENVVMLAGDAHMVAIDDGSNSGYGPSGEGFPVLHAAALDRGGSVKGGPYSHGTAPGGGQFGTFTVDDDGTGPLTVELAGHDWTGAELMSYTFTVPAEPAG
jgi:phosphodiesterase/alkaline phosphatase D-like protein